ncbi:MAG: restriction endonuclease subunit M [Bacteroidia bacterium]
MQAEVDILENDILESYAEVLEILLRDHTTQKNIFWATYNYKDLGTAYQFFLHILPELITGANGNIIMPRVKKDKVLQLSRVREMAEVFTPSWICNAQNNLIDNAWFGQDYVFNNEIELSNGTKSWEVNYEKIIFPEGKTWKHYVRDTRLEITCGEAPYITSRYDTTTGEFIPIEKRIGLLDRKLRVINENVEDSVQWLEATQTAYKNTYAFEWQGDSLLLAREAMLITFIENYNLKFGNEPTLESIQDIAYIISWNVWQMDGLKGVIPNSCKEENIEILDFFETKTETKKCKGCKSQNILLHNGTYCNIMDWEERNEQTGKRGKIIRFVDLLKK